MCTLRADLGLASGFQHANDVGRDVAIDNLGNIYITGSMEVIKLSPGGDQVITYTHGLYDSEGGYGIALDSANNIYLTGSEEVGVIKLSSSGSLVYHNPSLGGTGYDIAVDSSGNAYVAGSMGVVKINPSGNVVGSLALNGTATSLVIHQGYLIVAGFTSSEMVTTPGAFDASYHLSGDAFVAKLSTNLSLLYSTYLGGSLYDIARGVAVDGFGNIYLTGYTFSGDFPVTPNTWDATLSGLGDAFLSVLKPEGTGTDDLLFSSFIGGNDPAISPYLTPDRLFAIALDEAGHVYLAGEAGSYDFPLTQANPVLGFTDVVVLKLDLTGIISRSVYLPIIVR